MKVKLLKTGEILEANDCYGLRLIEQGKAILTKEAAPKPVKAEKEEPEVKNTKSRKGE